MSRICLTFVALILLGGLPGCGSPEIEVPENPTPAPKRNPILDSSRTAEVVPADPHGKTP